MLIAIDGPAGAGKSTVARLLAERLGFTYMDSGAMYRSVALAALEGGFELAGEAEPHGVAQTAAGASGERPASALGELARSLRIELGERISLDGRDVTEAIRAPEVAEAASRVAADPDVRAAMVECQRQLMGSGDWVAEGRDIGTVVAPHADVKVFLVASAQERARRRAAELQADAAIVLAEQALRDARDTSRSVSPLEPAADAVVIDTSDMPIDEVVDRIAALVR